MSKVVVPLLLGLGLGLAVLIAPRLSIDAGAVLIGVIVGYVASVPTSLLLVALLRRAQRNEQRTWQPPTEEAQQ